MPQVYIELSPAQAKKLQKGQAFQVSADKLQGYDDDENLDTHELRLTEDAYRRVQSAARRGKGYRFAPGDICECSGGSLKSIWRKIKKHAGSAIEVAKKFVDKDVLKGGVNTAAAALGAYTGSPELGLTLAAHGNAAVDGVYSTNFRKKSSTKRLKKDLKGLGNSAKRSVEGYADERIGEFQRNVREAQQAYDPFTGQGIGSFFKSAGRKIKRGAKKAFDEIEDAGKKTVKGIKDNKKLIADIAAQTAVAAFVPGPLQPAASVGAQHAVDAAMAGSGLNRKVAVARARVASDLAKGASVHVGNRVLMPMQNGAKQAMSVDPRTGGAIPVGPAPRPGRLVKGSQEAREHMAAIRMRRTVGGSFRSP